MSPTTACDCGGLETIWSTWLAGNVLRGYGYNSNFGLVNVWFPMTCLLHQEIPTMIPNKKRQQKRRRLMKWIRSWRFSAWCRLWHIASCDCEILWVVPPTFLSKVFSSFVEWQEDYYILPVVPPQGGGGSFKNRKPIGELGCCESGMAERSHWWTERCFISLTLSLSFSDYLPTYLSIFYVSIYLSIFLV